MSYRTKWIHFNQMIAAARVASRDETESRRLQNIVTNIADSFDGGAEFGSTWENRLRGMGEAIFANSLPEFFELLP